MRFKQGNQVRGALCVKFMFNFDWYDNWITLHVNLILNVIGMLDYLFLVRPFRVPIEEPLAKYNVK